MGGLPEDWKNIRNDFRYGTWLEALIEGRDRLELSTLADMWLKSLVDTGVRETDPSSGSIPKEVSSYYPNAGSPYADIRPAKLEDSREVIWLRADGHRTERGFKGVRILRTPLRTDTAIVAALTALEGNPPPAPERLDDSAIEAFLRLRQPTSGSVDMSEQEWMKG